MQSLIESQDGPTTTRTLGLVHLLDVLAQIKVTVKKHCWNHLLENNSKKYCGGQYDKVGEEHRHGLKQKEERGLARRQQGQWG